MADCFSDLCMIDYDASEECPNIDVLFSLPSVPSSSCLLQNAFQKHPRLFNCCHINASSLQLHFDEFTFLFETCHPHCIAISETWMVPSLPDSIIGFKGYNLIRGDRIGKKGGGVAIYLRDDLKFKVIASATQCGRPEFLFIECIINHRKAMIGVVYKAPNVGFLCDIEDVIFQLAPLYADIIVLGDWNINALKDTPDRRHMFDMLETCTLSLLPLQPTHHLPDSSSSIDHIIVSQRQKAISFGQIPVTQISKHDLIYMSYSLRVPKYQPFKLTFRNFKHCNFDQLKIDAIAMPWSEIDCLPTLDDKVMRFNQLVNNVFDAHAPFKTVRITRPQAPWMTPQIQSMRRLRDASFSYYKRLGTEENFSRYKFFRNKLKQLIRNSKLKFYFNLSTSLNTKKTWKMLKASGIGKGSPPMPGALNLDDLNNFFASSISPNLADVQAVVEAITNLPRSELPLFTFKEVSSEAVRQAIHRVKSRAIGSDKISISMLLHINAATLRPFTGIINSSLTSSVFPSPWKDALVRPLPKNSKPVCSSDFRPISLLPAMSKCLEYIAYDQLAEHLQEHNLLDPFQSGFRSHHSTCTALLRVVDDARLAIDNKKLTLMVLLDFSLAFNSVNYDILLAKLQRYNNLSESALSWVKSYLNERHQTVVGNDSSQSSVITLSNGVPQGSVLGPLLFSLYIQDVRDCFRFCKYHCYADDIQLYYHFSPSDTLLAFQHVNDDLSRILSWSRKNLLAINPGKCQAIVVGSQKMLNFFNSEPCPPLMLGGSIIPLSPTVKNLGIIIDQTLSWKAQVMSVRKKVFYCLHSLRRLKNVLPDKLRNRLIQSLVFPHFDYCDSLFSNLSVNLQRLLQVAQNNCIRFCCNIPYMDRVTPYYLHLSWLKLDGRRKLHQGVLTYKILHQLAPPYLSLNFNCLSNRRYNTRGVNPLAMPVHRTHTFHSSFIVSSTSLWNSIPRVVRDSPTIATFRTRFKEHLLRTAMLQL